MGCVQPVGRYGGNDCLTIYCGSYEFATMVAAQLPGGLQQRGGH